MKSHTTTKLKRLLLSGKNLEIEFAVRDLIKTISSYKLEVHVEEVSEEDIAKLKKVMRILII